MLKNPIYSNLQFLKSELAWLARKSIDFLVRITTNKPTFELSQKKKLLMNRYTIARIFKAKSLFIKKIEFLSFLKILQFQFQFKIMIKLKGSLIDLNF